MTDTRHEALNERERACMQHLRQAKKLGVSFSQYCRDQSLKYHQWTWVKRTLARKGVPLDGPPQVDPQRIKAAGFAPIRISPSEASAPACRLRHPSGWTIECESLPQACWVSALISGQAS